MNGMTSLHRGHDTEDGVTRFDDGRTGRAVPADVLLETGVIALINIAILWPRGLTLAASFGHDGTPRGISIIDCGAPIIDDPDATPTTAERIRALARSDAARFAAFEAATEPPME